MMRAASATGIHRQAYLEYESSSNVEHEFISGDIDAMAGRTTSMPSSGRT